MIVLDAEFTGLNPQQHSIISIGAVEFENPANQFYVECRPWDGADFDDEAMEVNGFEIGEVKAFPKSLEEAMNEFNEWSDRIEEHTLAGISVGHLDLMFLEDSFNRYHINFSITHRTIDIHTLTYMHMIKSGIVPPTDKGRTDINSKAIMEYVGIPEEPKPHNALAGAKVSAEAVSRLLYGKNLLPEFTDKPIPENLK